MSNLCAIDGSLLAFRAAAAGEKRTIIATHRESGNEKPFDNRRAFKAFLKETNEKREQEKKTPFEVVDFEIEDVIAAPPIENSLHVLKELMKYILSACKADEYIIYLDPDESVTFRHDLATMQEYKGNRNNAVKPKNLKGVRDYMVLHLKAKVINGGLKSGDSLEADDWGNFWQYKGWKETKKGGKVKLINVTFDKDANGNPGWIFDFRKKDKKPLMKEPVFIDGLGGIEWLADKKECKGLGRKFFYFQVLYGDDSDNYKANKLAGVRYGKKSAYEGLVDCSDDRECLQAVVDQYKAWYGDEFNYTSWRGDEVEGSWLTLLSEMWSLAYMRKHKKDVPDVKDILEKIGVEV